jgi:hypothetical protein
MRTVRVLFGTVLIGAAVVAGPALAFDGTKSDGTALIAIPPAPGDAFRSGTHWLKTGDKQNGLRALEYAADKGHPLALWKLGRMYADGDMVSQDDLKAFEYFQRIANSHAEDNPNAPEARFVANAFVALGQYYLIGIPNTDVKPDPDRAREMFNYAASYFGDPDAQYSLGRLYLDGKGAPHDPRTAARWFVLAAQKGHCRAQAMLGAMLFSGNNVPRQAARGLMWLTLAQANATATDQAWIGRLYTSAIDQANDDERALAGVYLKRWVGERRE